MKKALVAYFSASGVTAKAAETLAQAVNADLYEIQPEKPYTRADLDWTNRQSRSSVEMRDPDSRPAFFKRPLDLEAYDVVFVGFPIWWYVAPTIINTFLESFDFTGKTIVPFCTSGSSGISSSVSSLKPLTSGATWLEGQRFGGGVSDETVMEWVRSLNLAPDTQ